MKKLILYLAQFFLSILLMPIIIMVIILKNIILIRFGIIFNEKIGHLALDSELYVLSKKKLKNRYIIDIIGRQRRISNKFLLQKWKEVIFIFPFSFIIILISKLLKYFTNTNIHSAIFYNISDRRYLLNQYNESSIKINQSEKQKGYKILQNLGIKKNNSYICIHNRDNSYNEKYLPGKDWSYHSHRNFTVDSFNMTSEYLISKGIFVFRVGKSAEKRINLKNKKLIDYPFSNIKSDFMDIFLIANSKFYIGCDSGLSCVAYLFRKPMVLTNFTTINQLYTNAYNKEIIIFKHFYSKTLKKRLSLSEIFYYKINNFSSYNEYSYLNIELIENTQEEIYEAVREMENLIIKSIPASDEDNFLQNKFWKIMDKNSGNFHETKHKTRISSFFLRKNSYFLEE